MERRRTLQHHWGVVHVRVVEGRDGLEVELREARGLDFVARGMDAFEGKGPPAGVPARIALEHSPARRTLRAKAGEISEVRGRRVRRFFEVDTALILDEEGERGVALILPSDVVGGGSLGQMVGFNLASAAALLRPPSAYDLARSMAMRADRSPRSALDASPDRSVDIESWLAPFAKLHRRAFDPRWKPITLQLATAPLFSEPHFSRHFGTPYASLPMGRSQSVRLRLMGAEEGSIERALAGAFVIPGLPRYDPRVDQTSASETLAAVGVASGIEAWVDGLQRRLEAKGADVGDSTDLGWIKSTLSAPAMALVSANAVDTSKLAAEVQRSGSVNKFDKGLAAIRGTVTSENAYAELETLLLTTGPEFRRLRRRQRKAIESEIEALQNRIIDTRLAVYQSRIDGLDWSAASALVEANQIARELDLELGRAGMQQRLQEMAGNFDPKSYAEMQELGETVAAAESREPDPRVTSALQSLSERCGNATEAQSDGFVLAVTAPLAALPRVAVPSSDAARIQALEATEARKGTLLGFQSGHDWGPMRECVRRVDDLIMAQVALVPPSQRPGAYRFARDHENTDPVGTEPYEPAQSAQMRSVASTRHLFSNDTVWALFHGRFQYLKSDAANAEKEIPIPSGGSAGQTRFAAALVSWVLERHRMHRRDQIGDVTFASWTVTRGEEVIEENDRGVFLHEPLVPHYERSYELLSGLLAAEVLLGGALAGQDPMLLLSRMGDRGDGSLGIQTRWSGEIRDDLAAFIKAWPHLSRAQWQMQENIRRYAEGEPSLQASQDWE